MVGLITVVVVYHPVVFNKQPSCFERGAPSMDGGLACFKAVRSLLHLSFALLGEKFNQTSVNKFINEKTSKEFHRFMT